MKWIFVLITSSLFSSLASADYKCQLQYFDDINNNIFESAEMLVPDLIGGHGGQNAEFVLGDSTFNVTADGKWLGVWWHKGEKTIAQTTFLVTDQNQSRVGIFYNPENDKQYTYFTCDRITAPNHM